MILFGGPPWWFSMLIIFRSHPAEKSSLPEGGFSPSCFWSQNAGGTWYLESHVMMMKEGLIFKDQIFLKGWFF